MTAEVLGELKPAIPTPTVASANITREVGETADSSANWTMPAAMKI